MPKNPQPDNSHHDGLKPVDAVETHISNVFFTPDRVYKMLKPVETSFVSFKDRAARLAQTTREYQLNHRISPQVYLGVTDVMEGSEVMERLIVMRRLPEDRQLDRLIDAPGLDDHVKEVARFVAVFHARQEPIVGAAAETASAELLGEAWHENFQVLEPLVGSVLPAEDYDEAQKLADSYLAGRATLFAERIADGRVVDGHGDLRAEHVFCLDDGPQIIDCVAFRDDYRTADVLNDTAFLAMDLHRLAGAEVASRFIRYYDEFSNEHHPATLAHHYVAYRAHVRAKVAAVRHSQGDPLAASEVRRYHDLALQHLRVGQVRLVIVGGGAGAGKSTVAEGVADRIGATWLRSDEVRKATGQFSADQHRFDDPGAGLYAEGVSQAVYQAMLTQAESLLERGESVVLDATWSKAMHRVLARQLADRATATFTEIECTVPLPVAKERIARRMASVYNPSDATPEIAEYIAEHFEEWPSARPVDTSRSIVASIDDAYRLVVGQSVQASPAEPTGKVAVNGAVLLSYESIRFYLSKESVLPSTSRRGRP